jgi:pyridoxine 5-phosphate synthase
MAKLGLNVDHIATVRQARGGTEPDPVTAAAMGELAGAEGITIHLREDRRHIQDRDLEILRRTVQTKLNLEMAATDEMVGIACRIKPEQCTLVPEKRQELTTEGGLDVLGNLAAITKATARLREAGIVVSLFVDPNPEQIRASKESGADAIEIHTGRYAEAHR